MPDIAFKFKTLLLGPAAVGKTSLMLRFVQEKFDADYGATIGVKFLSKEVPLCKEGDDDSMAQLTLWDVGGQPRFLDLRTTFYKGANGALLIFDLTRRETFEEINNWHAEMTKVLERDVPFILIGNKSDLKGRQTEAAEAQEYAQSKNSIYIETSAKTGDNVEDAFFSLAQLMCGIDVPAEPILKETPKSPEKKPAKKAPKKVPKKTPTGETYIIKSKVRDYIKSKGCSTSGALLDGDLINAIILELLDKAIERAKANNRKTVQAKDL